MTNVRVKNETNLAWFKALDFSFMFVGEKKRKPRIYVKTLLGFKVANIFRAVEFLPLGKEQEFINAE